jgi:DNA-binding MarR family transcriptional regulator
LVNKAIVDGLNQRGFDNLRSTHTALLSNLDMEGGRLTGVAQRAGMTKQAMGRLADELIQLGYIERSPDPSDQRAVNLSFTKTGRELMLQSFDVMADIEKRCATRVGHENFRNLLESVTEITDELEN